MSTWVDEYLEEMNGLCFSEEKKGRIAERLESSLEAANADVVPFVRVAGETPDETPDEAAGETPDRSRSTGSSSASSGPWRCRLGLVRVAASVLLAFGIAGVSAYAYASGALGVSVGVIGDIFTGAPASTEVYNSVGYPIGASETCDGVTVTAEAVLGDTSNYVVIFSIRREDGTPLEGVSTNEGGTLNLLFTNGGTLSIDGVRSSGGKSFFFEGEGQDACIYYVYQGSVETTDDTSIIGRTARVELSDLRMTDENGTPARLIASGTWKFKLSMNYGDESCEVEEARDIEVSFGDVTATVERLSVSPIGVTLDLTSDDDVLDVRAVPLAVTFADGTTCRLDETAFVSVKWGWGSTEVRKSGLLDRITSVDDIVSVTVGTTVFSL